MIKNGKDTSLSSNPGTLPNVQGAILDWFHNLTFTRVTKEVKNFNVVETLEEISSQGVVQPFTVEQLMIKSEGQRSWKWFTIHALPSLILNNDEIIIYDGQNYRVKDKLDWSKYGYVEYHIIEDYTGSQ